jgi:hypothetical protein
MLLLLLVAMRLGCTEYCCIRMRTALQAGRLLCNCHR